MGRRKRNLEDTKAPRCYSQARAMIPVRRGTAHDERGSVTGSAPLAGACRRPGDARCSLEPAPGGEGRLGKHDPPKLRISDAVDTQRVGIIASTQLLTQTAIYRE